MVVGAFPVAKLGVLALKQISKPIANIIKTKAKDSQFFRRNICMPPAQAYNWIEVKTKMWAMNLGRPTKVPALNETMAIELGANLLGEFIIFTIGATILIFEYVRQVKKETRKEELLKAEKRDMQNIIIDIAFKVEKQDTQIREMSRVLSEIANRTSVSKESSELLEDLLAKQKSNKFEIESKSKESTTETMGNYNTKDGILFIALNSAQNKIFRD